MIRLIFIALVFSAPAQAQSFADLFGDPAGASPPEHVIMCKFNFGRGRNTLEVTHLDSGHVSECAYSRNETTSASNGWFNTNTYIYFYTCTDGTMARYSTNWMGNVTDYRHLPGGEQPAVKCE